MHKPSFSVGATSERFGSLEGVPWKRIRLALAAPPESRTYKGRHGEIWGSNPDMKAVLGCLTNRKSWEAKQNKTARKTCFLKTNAV